MTEPVAELADRSRTLPPEQRGRLLDLLLESLHQLPATEVAAAWKPRPGAEADPAFKR